MKIRFRFLLLLPLLLLLLTDPAFQEFISKDENDPLFGQVRYTIVGFGFACLLLYGRRLPRLMQGWALLVLLAHFLLALESYANWGSYMVYPHVFSKLMDMVVVLGYMAFYCRFGLPPLGSLMLLLLGGLMASLALLHPEALSMGAFLENERGFTVTSAYLFLPPAIYYLNRYFATGGTSALLISLGCLAMILFLQHRTVWLSTILALVINGLLLTRVVEARVIFRRLTAVLVIPLALGFTGGLTVVLDDPQVLRKLSSSLDDIQHVDKQGTGSWRLKQFEAYTPFVLERPIAGWRLEGFELPVQFYGDTGDAPVWDDHTGHHFHSLYMDRLFYFGVLGVLLLVVAPIWLVVRRVRQAGPLSPIVVALIAFSGSSLQYGLSFDWPLYQFGFIGLSLAAVALSAAETRPVAAPRSSLPVSSGASALPPSNYAVS